MNVFHSLLIGGDKVYSWGSNNFGELGTNTPTKSDPSPQEVLLDGPFIEVAHGASFSLFLKADHTLYGCGHNQYNQLNIKDKEYLFIPEKVPGIDGKIVQIACGDSHSLAMLSDGSLYSWGQKVIGSDFSPHQSPTLVDLGGAKVVQIDSGGNVSVACTSEGSVYYWGNMTNIKPLLLKGKFTKISCGDSHILAISKDGSLFSWGTNGHGQLGFGKTQQVEHTPTQIPFFVSKEVVQIACGGYHSLALLSDGSLYAWGHNLFGQLGVGCTSLYAVEPTQVKGIPDKILQMKCGTYHSMVMTDNELYCWGNNKHGQLGDGTFKDLVIPTKILRSRS
eukprot:TRINITY_DN3761_c0_g1_i2.p1 TRINITY_DN3761_c0_g1~~TRINITY_DN3761_c0_g1_i2.p1  ORF type:complete len:335 (+),score=73.84 TRINITY_DN3761_c0_g1_i2:82-1086(+)